MKYSLLTAFKDMFAKRAAPLGEYSARLYTKLFNPKWLNVTTSKNTIEQEIILLVNTAAEEIAKIRSLQSPYAETLLDEYAEKATLAETLARNDELIGINERAGISAAAEKIADELYGENKLDEKSTYILAQYYILTRRYERAGTLLDGASERFSEYSGDFEKLSEELSRRESGRHYMPMPAENRIEIQKKFHEFLRAIGVLDELLEPLPRIKPPRVRQVDKLSDDEYPDFPEIREAGFRTFVAYDVETTGLSDKFDEIIEIGAIKVIDGVVSEDENFTFQMFVKPRKQTISEKITELTGITKDDVQNAPSMEEMFNKFADFIGDNILIGFNNVNFDSKFLKRAGRYAKRIIENKQFDVRRLAAETLGISFKETSLASAASSLGIENPRAHRALADAVTTARVYLALLEMKGEKKEKSLEDILGDIDNW